MPSKLKPTEVVVNLNHKTKIYKEIREIQTKDGLHLITSYKRPLEVKDKKNPVILIHGLAQNRYSWDLSQRSFENFLVENGYETFNLELRGHGFSRTNGSSYPTSLEDYINYDLIACINYVKDITQSHKVIIIGHSLGGVIGYCAAALYKDEISQIVSIGGPTLFGKSMYLLKAFAVWFNLINNYTLFQKIKLPFFPVDLIGWGVLKFLFYLDHPNNIFPYQVWYPRSIERELLIERIEKGFDRTGYNILKLMLHWAGSGRFEDLEGKIDYNDYLKKIDIPILFIVGGKDKAVPLSSILPGYNLIPSEKKEIKIFGKSYGNLVEYGHIDLILGKYAPIEVWPYILNWLNIHERRT